MDATARGQQVDDTRFPSTRARAAKAWLDARVAELEQQGASERARDRAFSPELAVLKRIQPFRFADYPDYTAPWHLLQWPHQRWAHVFDVVMIVERLRHAKGSAAKHGGRIRLEPFQVLILLCFLGPQHPETGRRLVREGLLTISRKNAKTTLIAGIALALMVLHHEAHGLKGQEIYVGASDRQQASILFDVVNKFIMQDDALGIEKAFRTVPSRKHMTHRVTLTEFQVLSSDAYRAHGLNPAVVIFDEMGNVPATLAEEFYSVLTSGFGAQDEPLTLLLSTQAAADTHVFSGMVDRAKRINEGAEDAPSVAGFIFETPETIGKAKLDPFDPHWWYLSNPGIGTIVSLEDMQQEAEKAKSLPSLESKFRNLRLNQRANPHNPLISKSLWQSCALPVDPHALLGRRCWAALDLSTTTDLTALVLVFEAGEDGRRPVLPFFWIPGDGLSEREARDKVPYSAWARAGFIDTSSLKTVDYQLVAFKIQECMADYEIEGFGFDRWRVNDMKAALRTVGLEDLVEDEKRFFAIGQGYQSMAPAIDTLERALLDGTIAHGGHPVLTWNAANAVSVSDPAGNRKLDKSKSYGRIDGIVALAMALRVPELLSHEAAGPSQFESSDCLM